MTGKILFKQLGFQPIGCGSRKEEKQIAEKIKEAKTDEEVHNIINDIIPLWMYYALRFNNLNRFAQGVAQPGISVSIINEMPLILPPLPLQQEFAKKIEAIEKQKELIRKSIGEVETLFNSRMDYYFSE